MRGPWEFESPLCREIDSELFFPDKMEQLKATTAMKICGSCIHKAECAEWGIHNETFGIWGGMSDVHRRIARRKKGIRVRENFVA